MLYLFEEEREEEEEEEEDEENAMFKMGDCIALRVHFACYAVYSSCALLF
jgi:hypothetical protein